jgi:glycoprotein-N-acetylgalactosamine 3-beta-galactosyltransferase
MQLLRRTHQRIPRRNRFSLPLLICCLFLTFWALGMWFISSYVLDNTTKLPPSNSRGKRDTDGDTQASPPVVLPQSEPHASAPPPWYGWQPSLHENVGIVCDVTSCLEGKGTFNDHDTCSKCLDDPKDFDNVPDPGPDWIPDAKMLHTMLKDRTDANGNPWPPPLDPQWCQPMGVFGGPHDDNKKLLDGVPIRGIRPPGDDEKEDGNSSPTIFCGVYTMEVNHASNVRAMRETWAPHCNGFVAFSTADDPRIPALNLHHEGAEEYNNMWQKSRSIWRYIGAHYLNDFDYFILGGEDLLVIPENLRAYLKSLSQSPESDLFAGRRFKGYEADNYFNSGGAGYVLSRGTLRKLYETGLDHPRCNPHRHTPMEDVMIAECLRKVFSVGLTDTRDDQGRERFHPFAPGLHLTWEPPQEGGNDWYEDYNKEWGLKLGLECCAPDSVSFHYIKKPATVRHLWSLLYHC